MPNPAIPRAQVHALAEACSDAREAFEPIAARLLKEQRRLGRFIERNAASLGAGPAQTAVYMCAVTVRIFEQVGGRLRAVTHADLDAAAARVATAVDDLLPVDKAVPERLRSVSWRAQPHLLDEILWALYEKETREEGELQVEPPEAFLLLLTLWAIVEALDARWTPPEGFGA
ncbi:MAG: hypothetical protein JXB39_08525 [Deltaproteobacteria bacterium]|nr:hypothetical protein [Deltaproteobacteria bacterium]